MKSYSWLTKEELVNIENSTYDCEISEFLGILLFACNLKMDKIRFVTENKNVSQRFKNLSDKLFNTNINIDKENIYYTSIINNHEQVLKILLSLKLISNKEDRLIKYKIRDDIIKDLNCKYSFLRGAFLGGGTIIDPKKNYNLEFVTHYLGLSRDFVSLMNSIGFSCRVAKRKSNYVIYIKNSETICDILTALGAKNARNELIQIKIKKELRNELNRSANSETANIDKVISASIRQIQAIEKIDKIMGLESLNDDLREIAKLRLENRQLSLGELGSLLAPPLTKSGVNHRLRKLIKMAGKL